MKTFITEVTMEGIKNEGPRISALAWDEAQDIVGRITWRGQDVVLIGELAS